MMKPVFHQAARTLSLLLSTLVVASCASDSASSAVESKRFEFGQHGTVAIDVPTSWTEGHASFDTPALVHLSYTVPGNSDFEMFISVLPESGSEDGDDAIIAIGRRTLSAGERWLPRTVETAVDLRPLDGPAMLGYYFSLTDRTTPLPAGEFKYITQGLALAHEIVPNDRPIDRTLMVGFTLFSNDGQAALVQRGLGVVKSVRLEKSE
jgi:hypothetical protein